MKWYYVENGQQAGPVEDTEFPQLVRAGKLRAGTLVWREGMANWEPFSKACPTEFAATTASVTAGTEAVCAECGGLFDRNEMIPHGPVFICAKCKPVFLQKLAEGAVINTGELRYAGFWIRVVAKILDGLILGLPMMAVFVFVGFSAVGTGPGPGGGPPALFPVAMMFSQFFFFAVSVLYSVLFVGKYGATPGKMICKLRVVMADRGKVTYGRATGRAFADMLSGMLCYIGYLLAAFDDEKRSLHDHICNTRVIYK